MHFRITPLCKIGFQVLYVFFCFVLLKKNLLRWENRLVCGQRDGISVRKARASPTSLTLCVTAQVRKTRDMTWNPVRTTEDGTIPKKHNQKEIILLSEDVQMTDDALF